MGRTLTIDQRLRLTVEAYGQLLGIKGLYDRTKKYEWKIRNSKDRSEKWKERKIESYRAGIVAVESGIVSKHEEVLRIYHLHTKATKQRKTKKK
jgi:predicted transcriptional regulator